MSDDLRKTVFGSRDTQFQGFAKLLLEEIMNNNDVWFDTSDDTFKEDWQLLIAQHAYDLACHVLENINRWDIEDYRGESGTFSHDALAQIFIHVPDLTQWPTKDELQ
ncbi:MAG TPA: hypothetical protein VEL31_11035 [Ktedonobacteraceae bacterium]|nr:hypothetical protein [Ktedonobacteraceae bacterium]